MSHNLDRIDVTRKMGHECFVKNGTPLEYNLMGFWQWACSNLTDNTMRGVLAEYIVACALNLDIGVRLEWSPYDLVTKNGLKLEVKSAAYLQTWEQAKLSAISFDISPKKNEHGNEIKRHADIYIFCLLEHQDKPTVNPLDLDQWIFYLLPTATLDEKKPNQRTITMSALLELKPVKAAFAEISKVIEKITINL